MIVYRTAREEELSTVLDWAATEGWNPGLEDAPAFFAADTQGFFVAVEDDRPVAAISVVNHTDHFAFLGLYIALPDMRGQGVGYGLWTHALAHAGTRTIGLDGVPEQQGNYEMSGFVAAGGTTRFAGQVTAGAAPSVRPARPDEVPELIAREARASGVEKARYLSAWFEESEGRQTLVDEGSVGLTGFCTVRRCRAGAKIGPLIADDAATASRLMEQAAGVFGEDITIDVPNRSAELSEICGRFGLQPGFQTARMYKGPAPKAAGGFFAVTSLELG